MWIDRFSMQDIKAGLYLKLHQKEVRELTDNEVNLLYFLSLDADLQEIWREAAKAGDAEGLI